MGDVDAQTSSAIKSNSMKRFLFVLSLFIFFNNLVVGQATLKSASEIVTDSIDATFEIINLDKDTVSMRVFNRWGELMIRHGDTDAVSGSYTFTFGINDFPSTAVYYYVISTNDSSWNGHLTALWPVEPFIEINNLMITDTSDLIINISFLQRDTINISVYDVTGIEIVKEVNNQVMSGKQEFTYSITDFELSGHYIVRLQINDSSTVFKVFVSSSILDLPSIDKVSKPSIFPNPFLDKVILNNFENVEAISLTSIHGLLFWQGNNVSELENVLEAIVSGTYILILTKTGFQGNYYSKIVKE